MSLTPSSKTNARALAHLVEQERNNLTWWKQPAYIATPEPGAAKPDLEWFLLARRLNREFMARRWSKPKQHASRYLYRKKKAA